jgi:dephospho-CoA kinase
MWVHNCHGGDFKPKIKKRRLKNIKFPQIIKNLFIPKLIIKEWHDQITDLVQKMTYTVDYNSLIKKKGEAFFTCLWLISSEEWRLQKMIGKIKLNKKRVGET